MFYCIGETRCSNSYFILDSEDSSVERISCNQLQDLRDSGVVIQCFNPHDSVYKVLMVNNFERLSFGYRFNIARFKLCRYGNDKDIVDSVRLSLCVLDKNSGYDYIIGADLSFVSTSSWYLENMNNYGYNENLLCGVCLYCSKRIYYDYIRNLFKDYDLQTLGISNFKRSVNIQFIGWIAPVSLVSYIIELYNIKNAIGLMQALGLPIEICSDTFCTCRSKISRYTLMFDSFIVG